MQKNYLLTVLMMVCSLFAIGQNGEISGKVTDEYGEGIPFANVAIVENGVATGAGAVTDFDGKYTIKPLTAGQYDIKFSVLSYTAVIKTSVVVKNDQTTFLDQQLTPASELIEEVVILEYKVPLIDPGETSSKNTITAEDIADLPTRDVEDIATTTAGVTSAGKGEGISIRGSRGDAVVYYIDGIRVNGAVNLPTSAIEQIDIITGGVSAKYGEATGGVVNLTSKRGVSKLQGSVQVQSSLDVWRDDLAVVSLRGPMVKNEDGATVIGYSVNGEYSRKKDYDPSAVDLYKVKDDVMDDLRETPLFLDEEGVIRLTATEITSDDLEKTKIKENTTRNDVTLNGRLDFRLNDKMSISVGGNFNYSKYHFWIDQYSLFNYENNPERKSINGNAFMRFTHNFRKDLEEGEEKGRIQNGFYQIQVDFEKFKKTSQDDSHGDNFFAYGYVGQFEYLQEAQYGIHEGDNPGDRYYELIGYNDTGVVYTPMDVNDITSNYTQQYIDLGGDIEGIINETTNGLAPTNGVRAQPVHSLWYGVGRQYNAFGVDNDDEQYRATINGGFDIVKPGEDRNKHALTFGIEFETRMQRAYSVSNLVNEPSSNIWAFARQLTNSHLDLDKSQAYLLQNGERIPLVEPYDLYAQDTVVYDYGYADGETQTDFDRNLRERIGAGEFDLINIDNLSLDVMTVDLFSADELIGIATDNRSGAPVRDYRGYDVYGNRQSGAVSFEDFWNKVDENGNKTRPIGAFNPIYVAGYIEDKFQLNDLTFRLGVRVDAYNANQQVLKDPYSILGSRTVGDVSSLGGVDVSHPSTIGDDYIVYVDDAFNPTAVLGYRDGKQWYNIEGVEVENFDALGTDPVPYVPEGQGETTRDDFVPSLAFEDYSTSVIVMPRLQFSFNITDDALFFAHYDILSQRPQSRFDINDGGTLNRAIGSPLDYYFFNNLSIINNPALKPETTIDFQLGFKQKLSATSAITFSAYYKEFKNQVQVVKIDGAFPKTGRSYLTYDNVDFGNTKGFEFGYDLRRTKNVKLNANYTLQFSEGTGSDDRTQLDIVNSPDGANFRSVNPLDYDSRHSINASIDYRFSEGKEYNGPVSKKGKQILSNFGINLLAQARSGTPYTKQSNVEGERIIAGPDRPVTQGYINGARIGWNFTLGLKINKSFTVTIAKDKEDKEERNLYFDVYLRVDNLLGTANVRSVYRYTGQADDDGFIDSYEGQSEAATSANAESYRDLYKVSVNHPDNYGAPRRIYIGASIDF